MTEREVEVETERETQREIQIESENKSKGFLYLSSDRRMGTDISKAIVIMDRICKGDLTYI